MYLKPDRFKWTPLAVCYAIFLLVFAITNFKAIRKLGSHKYDQ